MVRRLLASRWFYIVAGTLMILAFLMSQVRIGSDPRPPGSVADIETLADREDLNVLFILIDTLRADRLSAYGYARETSPTIDELARTGLRFARQQSQSSWTKCSMASLWTGLYPIRTGVLRSPQALPDSARMPAEILRDAGFRTFAIWRNGWISPQFGFSQGFEMYYSPPRSPVPRTVRRENPIITLAGTDQDTARSAIEFFRTHGKERWFLYLHLMDVHQYVYDEDTALFGTSYSDIYDNSIRWVDRIVGSVVHEIDRRGLREKTLIILAADHGESFGEHGNEGHARDVYGEVTTTPFILSFPFRLDPGIVVDARTQNVDLWPTILDLLDLTPLEDTDGRSRVPEILSAANAAPSGSSPMSDDGMRFAHIDQAWGRTQRPPRPMVAVNEGKWRLIYRQDRPGRTELYEIYGDPLEQRNRASEEPEILARLTGEAQAYLQRPPAPWGEAVDVELDEEELEHLRALGYDVGKP
ncbi:MAG: sulfatase [Betaproteobacteria bacterium]|nr:sulfatase [Betaproteobacteria bacterium]